MSDAPFLVRVSPARVWFYMLLISALAVTVVAVSMILKPFSGSAEDWFTRLFGAGIALMFLYGAGSIGRSLFYQGAMIAVDAKGIRMPSCYHGVLPWGAIARAEVLKGRLHFWFAENAVIPPGKGLEHILRTNRSLSRTSDGPDFAVTTWLADRRTPELVAAVRARAPQLFV